MPDDTSRLRTPLTANPSQCALCVHWQGGRPPTCDAFPDGVPLEIIRNRFDHRKPYPGDHGIQFEPKTEAA